MFGLPTTREDSVVYDGLFGHEPGNGDTQVRYPFSQENRDSSSLALL